MFKPHGSVNWINEKGKEYQINDYNLLKQKKKHIDIITPGSYKYKYGMVNSVFRVHREIFNDLISDSKKKLFYIYLWIWI